MAPRLWPRGWQSREELAAHESTATAGRRDQVGSRSGQLYFCRGRLLAHLRGLFARQRRHGKDNGARNRRFLH
eukprot:361927-Chlamydomonas_euryale.AAC.7